MRRPLVASSVLALAYAIAPGSAHAEFGNLSYTADELFQPISYFDPTNMPCPNSGDCPTGSDVALVLDGFLIVEGIFDSGALNGPLHVFDVKDPRNPVLLTTIDNEDTQRHREPHAMAVSVIGGRQIVALPTRPQGVHFWDFTNPMTPTLVSRVQFSNSGGDYTNATWQLSWSGDILFASATGNGVDVVDTSDIMNPQVMTRIPVNELGFTTRVGPIYAVGRHLILANMDSKELPMHISIVDVIDPMSPSVVATVDSPGPQYSMLVNGDKIYSLGGESSTNNPGQYKFWEWSLTPPSVTMLHAVQWNSRKGGYCQYQESDADGTLKKFVHCGQSEDGLQKIDVTDIMNPQIVGSAKVDRDNADMDFATVLGNLVYLGNDHGTGNAFVPHQMAPDTTPPQLIEDSPTFPADGEANVDPRTHITIFLSDAIDSASINAQSAVVRVNGGAPIEGVWSLTFNALAFAPAQDWPADTTLAVELNGLRDVAGNAMSPEYVTFCTGAMCDPYDGPIDPGAGGAGGMAGAGGGGMAGTAGTMNTGGMAGAAGAAMTAGGGTGGQISAAGDMGGAGVPVIVPPTVAPVAPESEGGCACSTPGDSGNSHPWWGLLAIGLAGVGHRVRRTRRV